ncbi:DUF2059 domain-containing protein [Planktotalea sp.]|uniref:DUF2059 domain-containing protein n=1 Tax=Planktotalea sp. TaxID=2029877 RepID=UPI003D6BEB6D
MARLLSAVVSVFLVLGSVPTYASEASDTLLSALGMERMVELMRLEGLEYAVELGDEMLPGGYTENWGEIVSRVYDTEAMAVSVRRGFAKGLEGVDLAPLEQFFYSPKGSTIVELELSAREAMMERAIEDAAKETARGFELAGDDAFLLVKDFIAAGDLLEANVTGALNSNIQFYRGLVDGGAFDLSEQDILEDVWSQEEETRAETRDWLYGFLIMAYMPLEPGVLESYTALSKTPEGKALNAALFEGFDSMYGDISYGLGLAAAREMMAEDI